MPKPKPRKSTVPKPKRPGKPEARLKIPGTFMELLERSVKTPKPPGGWPKETK
jgi:hypothetical protein